MNGTHTEKVPGGEVVVRDSPSLISFLFLMAATGCALAFVTAGLQGDYFPAITGLYACGVMSLGTIMMMNKAI